MDDGRNAGDRRRDRALGDGSLRRRRASGMRSCMSLDELLLPRKLSATGIGLWRGRRHVHVLVFIERVDQRVCDGVVVDGPR